MTRPRKGRNAFLVVAALTVCASCGTSFNDVANLDASGAAVVCFGDSITRGCGASPGEDYPSHLARLLGDIVVNAGRDGDTTASALRRLDAEVLTSNPRLVIVALGGNDVLNKVPLRETVANLDDIVERCTGQGAMVAVVHCKFGLFSDPYRKDFEAVAARHGAVMIPRALKGVWGNPQMMHDQVHPNGRGYARIAERVAQTVGPLLEAADAQRARAASARNAPPPARVDEIDSGVDQMIAYGPRYSAPK